MQPLTRIGRGGNLILSARAAFLRRGNRKIGIAFIEDVSLRCFEVVNGHFTHTTTVDVRAWIGQARFLLWIELLEEGFLFKIPAPDESYFVAARSAKVRGVYT